MSLNLKRPLAFFDIESTGINLATDRIVDMAIIKVMPDNSRDTRNYRFNPGIPIPAASTAIHGISDEDVKDAPRFAEKAHEIHLFLQDADLAGYNSNRFDIPLLIEEFLRAEIVFETKSRQMIDAFRIFSKMEKRDLTSAYQFFCGKILEDAHSAEADIVATIEVLEAQIDRYKDHIENDIDFLGEFSKEDNDFVDFGRRMIYIDGEPHFNFGKYKGRKVKDVLKKEPHYYHWIMNNDFMLHTKQKLKEIMLSVKLEG